ncbi:MAG: beta-ketoacyl-ACP synthase II [Candidatus Auribacterota bacterium]|jgi:beta-ketoacyl-acyl-carrier-protein synthase II|uniref:3-oxoacyl-[acyl-carrier-protein] synthase 2 n=1 Tax=Candidatus Auribacter fodinae TaxID=2093366 RepID=A0A3A4QWK2_9BACT|nr:MAG: beta-ketoacyl-[acyl-carrier-protein] synthase II [Candidatus Auribacter fodinae]
MRKNISPRRVVVTGLGVVSPVGNTIDEYWDSLCNGKSGVDYITHFDASEFTTRFAAEVKNFDPEKYISKKDVKRMDEFVQFAVCASYMAVEDAGLDFSTMDPYAAGVLIGSGIGGMNVIETQHKILLERGPARVSPFLIPMLITNMASGQVSINFGIRGPNLCIATACASGSHAIGEAYRHIALGEADVMITGGTESATTPLGLAGFCSIKALSQRNDEPQRASRPFDRDRDGFVMGEGAGIVILEEYESAKKRNAKIYCELLGYGCTGDAYHMTAPSPGGEGAARCIQMALLNSSLNPEQIDYINAHGTSTPLNDKFETQSIKSAFGDHAYKLAVSSTKSMTGHLLGAAGGIELVACAKVIETGVIPPTINYENPDPECDLDYVPNTAREADVKYVISNSLGFGGHNATLVVGKI